MNSEFHIGDVVRVTKYGHVIYGQLPIGLQGYIARFCDEFNADVVSVNFEMSNWHEGHNSNGYFPGADTYWNFYTRSRDLESASSIRVANIKELF